ncbi:hypothetical protein GOBAR_AA18131 [Gossypium barbadense]|uniref:HD/PDEase domain-containing protein n=5 Tax=Gossypium TaxID=3633 RepID=A0A2P5XGU8_GOSBA|nr:hypothetical protein GOBAR_AA18131 [Gossypium barbadense]
MACIALVLILPKFIQGLAHLVYPGAVHSRFEHSLGVYWLAGEAIQKLKTYQGLELGIDRFDVQAVKVAGLLHDVGHGPFSHLFEREFLPKVLNSFKLSLKFIDTEQFQRLRELKQLAHEQMSADLIDHIVDVHHIDVESEMIKRVKLDPNPILGKNQIAKQLSIGVGVFSGRVFKVGVGELVIGTTGESMGAFTGDRSAGNGEQDGNSEVEERLPSGSFMTRLPSQDPSRKLLPFNRWQVIVRPDESDGASEPEKFSGFEVISEVGEGVSDMEMILASSEFALPKSAKEKQFLYDIVANGRNGIDVDKFDYIVRDSRACGLGCSFDFHRLMETMRVLGDEICYRAKDYLSIHKLFATRADLYRTVYTHSKVKAVELMVVDALLKANSYLEISSSIQDPSEYWKLDDTIIKTIETAPDEELRESRDLILRIRRRNLYQFCNEYSVPKDQLEHFKDVTAQDIACSQKNGGVLLQENDIAVSNVRIDLTRGKQNPLESINFFKDYESQEKFPIPHERISHLLPTSYQDMIVRVYSKKPELVAAVSEAFENFQLKIYGVKAQVHATPEKKKRRF